MTPDAAFGYERGGTPDSVRELGERKGFDLVVVDLLAIDGAAVRSSDIRTAIASGDLAVLDAPWGVRSRSRARLAAVV